MRIVSILISLAIMVTACARPATEMVNPSPSLPAIPTILPTQVPSMPAPTATMPPAPTVTPTQIPPSLTPTQATTGLTIDVLKNAEYKLPNSFRTVKLAGGSYKTGSGGVDAIAVNLLDPIAFGDLNGDGQADAVVLLAINSGGSGTFVWAVVMLAAQGQPFQSGTALIGDRAKITSLAIQPDRKIVLTGTIQGPGDAMCCPRLQVTETFQLTKRGLELVRLTSQTPDGKERSITIESPSAGTQVSGSVEAKGSVTIAPFENSLAYRISDGTGKQWAKGPIQVESAEMGGPGAFDTTIDLSNIPPGPLIRLEILDLSAADGSILAMDSVELLVK